MICTECRRPIRASETARAHVIKDEKGRVKEALHNKCVLKREKRARRGELGRWRVDSPTAYVEALRHRNRDDLDDEERERVRVAEERYLALVARVKQGAATDEDRVELDDLAVARDGETLDYSALELEGAEEQARAANEAMQKEREKESAPESWDDWRGESRAEI